MPLEPAGAGMRQASAQGPGTSTATDISGTKEKGTFTFFVNPRGTMVAAIVPPAFGGSDDHRARRSPGSCLQHPAAGLVLGARHPLAALVRGRGRARQHPVLSAAGLDPVAAGPVGRG